MTASSWKSIALGFLFLSSIARSHAEGNRFNWKSVGVTGNASTQVTDFGTINYNTQIYGLRFSNLNQRKFGIYYGLQLNQTVLGGSKYQFDDQQQTHNFSYDLVFVNQPHEFGKASLDLGFTKKVMRASWFYFGSGLCYHRSFHEVSLFEEDGRFVETIEAEKTNLDKRYTPSGELGFVFNLRLFNIGLGIKSYDVTAFDFNDAYYSVMLGLTLKRKNQK
ncbi:MAG: hypothetical protein JJ975_04075 [Bacteroidia bacterium]|nr:hypothetical protein [Bacteroidia bacterium]